MAYADFGFIVALTVSHDCEDAQVRSSVEGISVSIPRHGVAILVEHGGFFVGICTCGQVIKFDNDELRQRI